MTDQLVRRALDDTLTFLGTLVRDAAQPPEALARLALLRLQHPGLDLDLVWDASPYPSTVHFDALLRAPGADTVSLSVCPVDDTPWPLRGVRLASDHDLVRVNGETLKVREAMECLDFLWNEARILQALVDLCLIEEAVKRWSIVPAAEHTQRALDAFRSARGLLAASDMHTWMHANALTPDRLAHMMHGRAQEFALREHIAREGVGAYADAHPRAFDVAHLARMRVRTRERAYQLAEQVSQRGFHEVMEDEFSARRLVALRHGSLEAVRRRDISPDHAAHIFAAAARDVIGPLESDAGFDIVRVIRIEIADPHHASTRHAVVDAMFDEWLGARRRAATIEWFWGPAGA